MRQAECDRAPCDRAPYDDWIEPVYAAFADSEPARRRCACPTCFYALQQRRGIWRDAFRSELRRRVRALEPEVERVPMTAALDDPAWLAHAIPWLLERIALESERDPTGSFRQSVLAALRAPLALCCAADSLQDVSDACDLLRWIREHRA